MQDVGTLQLVKQSEGDFFLNGNPEISLFNAVYKQYTNFAIELLELPFNSNASFGNETTVDIKNYGDLAYRAYLKVDIPEVSLKKTLTAEDQETIQQQKTLLATAKQNYAVYQQFCKINYSTYTNITEQNTLLNSVINNSEDNSTIIQSIYQTIKDQFNLNLASITNEQMEEINNLIVLMNQNPETQSNYIIMTTDYANVRYSLNMNDYTQTIEYQNFPQNPTETSDLIALIRFYQTYAQMVITNNQNFDKLANKFLVLIQKTINILNVPRYSFAWVDYLGFALIESIDAFIDGNKIDTISGQWMYIWNQLTGRKKDQDRFNELIGNVPELTTYNNSVKPKYQLIIPLSFWFNKFAVSTVPLVSMQYSKLSLRFKFRRLSDVAYSDFQVVPLNQLENKFKLNCSLLIDYVFLTTAEREKLARASQELLIEQVQTINFTDSLNSQTFVLPFTQACKGFIWVLQKKSDLTKSSGTSGNINACQWFNFLPIPNSSLTLSTHPVSTATDSLFFNEVQTLEKFQNSPENNIYGFWFSIYPTHIKPSGFCNASYIRAIELNINLTDSESSIIESSTTNNQYVLTCYALNYNVLRVIHGFANVAFV